MSYSQQQIMPTATLGGDINRRLAFTATAVLALFLVIPAGDATALVISDDFSTSHTHWDGSSVDVSGTIWDGMQGTSFAEFANANGTNAGELTIRKNSTNNSGSDSPFDSAALYLNVTGDFDAKVEMPGVSGLDTISFRTHSLAAWTDDGLNAIHLDNILGTGNTRRFRDLVPPDDFADGGGGTNGWFRLERVGDDFNGYWGTDGTSWTLLDTITGAYGDTLRVGLATWNASSSAFRCAIRQLRNHGHSGTVRRDTHTDRTAIGRWPQTEANIIDRDGLSRRLAGRCHFMLKVAPEDTDA